MDLQYNAGDNFVYRCTTGIFRMRATYKSLRYLQLYVPLFNAVHQNLIFTWKLLSIGTSIVSGYAAIVHFQDYPVIGVMYCVLLINASLIYMLLYENGFKVPEKFHKAKSTLRLRGSGRGRGKNWKVLDRQLMPIPSVGIKVGEFHMLERTSTPLFLHYVLTNIVNMLVAYR